MILSYSSFSTLKVPIPTFMHALLATSILSILALNYGCADAEFAGQNARSTRPPTKPPILGPPTDNVQPPGPNDNPPGIITDGGNTVACTRAPGAISYDFSIPRHKDSVTSYSNNYPVSDVEQSSVVRFHVSNIVGDLLPVSAFGLDDVAFIVKETDQFSKIGRTITIPDHALIIKDGNNAAGASGRIDSARNTTYIYKGQQRVISSQKQDLATALNTIGSMGIQPINHNQIKISEMREKGFIDANGIVAFKVVHVAHGHGYLNMTYTLQPCK